MISKGTTHNNGARLAEYLTTGKEGERAELWELRGFEATDIKDAFRNVQIMAEATKAQQPLFHVQVRNREGETLPRRQFEYAADRIERMLGLKDQPRAIAFHIDERTGEEHMHVAWSRIDQDTMTAIPLPYFKFRLKKISRELELHFGLEPVTNHREGNIKFAPTRAEHEQARRLGLDVHEVRNTIRDLWDRSDSGRSFQAALEHEGFALAQGERRDFVVIDQAGGMHPLGKRILDVTASKIRDRLSDISRDDLPSVEMARALMPERTQERVPEKAKQPEKPEPVWDREASDRSWQEAVINAAIDKEKAERNFVEAEEKEPQNEQREKTRGSRKKEWPVMPPTPEPIRTSPEYHFDDAARNGTRNRTYTPPKELKGMSNRIMGWVETLRNDPDLIPTKVKSLSAVLDDKGIALARATKDEADRSHREAEFAKAVGRYAPRFREGEIVAVTEPPLEYRHNGEIVIPGRVHKLDQEAAAVFVEELDKPKRVQGIEATKLLLNERAEQRADDREAARLDYATNIKDFSRKLRGKSVNPVGKLEKIALRGLGKTLDVVSDALGSLFAPTLTPRQQREADTAAQRREAEVDSSIAFSRFTAEMAEQRRQHEQNREAERHRQRDERER